jgi:hypothetical protein
MPDQVYDWLEAFQRFMDQGSLLGAIASLLLTFAAGPLLVLVHELGHALAVRARGLPLALVKVGDTEDVILTVGGFRLELGRLLGQGDVGGYVLYDGRAAAPADVLVIALAGPLANLAGAAVTGWLALRVGSGPNFVLPLWLMTISGVWMAAANLGRRGRPGEPLSWSDGVWVRAAWRVLRRPGPLWRDPNEGTSVAPPQAATGS